MKRFARNREVWCSKVAGDFSARRSYRALGAVISESQSAVVILCKSRPPIPLIPL